LAGHWDAHLAVRVTGRDNSKESNKKSNIKELQRNKYNNTNNTIYI